MVVLVLVAGMPPPVDAGAVVVFVVVLVCELVEGGTTVTLGAGAGLSCTIVVELGGVVVTVSGG